MDKYLRESLINRYLIIFLIITLLFDTQEMCLIIK